MCGCCVQAEPFMCTYVGDFHVILAGGLSRYIGEGKKVLLIWERNGFSDMEKMVLMIWEKVVLVLLMSSFSGK